MTKTIVRLALAGAAAASFALPHAASAAEAPCSGTFVVQCVENMVGGSISQCVNYGTYELICLPAN